MSEAHPYLTHGLINASPMPIKKKPPPRSLMGVTETQRNEPYVHSNQFF
jgi:hypothetical protein